MRTAALAIVEVKTGPHPRPRLAIPLGLMMTNRLPFVFSLHRGYA